MASSTSYNTAGNREDLTDIISILEPESTPFVSMMKKGRATGTFVEWQADKLSTPDFDGVRIKQRIALVWAITSRSSVILSRYRTSKNW